MVKAYYYLAGCALLLIAGVFLYAYSDSLAGAAVAEAEPTQGVVCCTFEYQGAQKTCATPEGQTCQACNEICQQHQ